MIRILPPYLSIHLAASPAKIRTLWALKTIFITVVLANSVSLQ